MLTFTVDGVDRVVTMDDAEEVQDQDSDGNPK